MFDMPDYDGHRSVHWFHDAPRPAIAAHHALHDTTLGPLRRHRMGLWRSADAA